MNDSDALPSLAAGLIAMLVASAGILLVLRTFPRAVPVKVFAVGIASAMPLSFAVSVPLTERFLPWLALPVVGAVGVAHFFLFAAIFKSVSLQMLVQLELQPRRQMSMQRLVDTQGRPIVEGRMRLLVEMGMAERMEDGRYRATASGRLAVRRLQWIQGKFGVRRSGLYRPQAGPSGD